MPDAFSLEASAEKITSLFNDAGFAPARQRKNQLRFTRKLRQIRDTITFTQHGRAAESISLTWRFERTLPGGSIYRSERTSWPWEKGPVDEDEFLGVLEIFLTELRKQDRRLADHMG